MGVEEEHMRVINVITYNPARSLFKSSRNERESVTIISCSLTECELLKEKECLVMNGLGFYRKCPYSKVVEKNGYTRKARKFGDLLSKYEEEYPDLIRLLGPTDKKIARVGEYIYLDFPFMFNYVNPIVNEKEEKEMFYGRKLLKEKYFTNEFLEKIVLLKPSALMGGTIKDHNERDVPNFVKDLESFDKEKYEYIVNKYPKLINKIDENIKRYNEEIYKDIKIYKDCIERDMKQIKELEKKLNIDLLHKEKNGI